MKNRILFLLAVLLFTASLLRPYQALSQSLGNNILEQGDFEIDYYNKGTTLNPIYVPLYGYRIPQSEDWLAASVGLFVRQSTPDVDFSNTAPYPNNMACTNNNPIISCSGWFKTINWSNYGWRELYPGCVVSSVGSSDYFHLHGNDNKCNWNNIIDFRKPAEGEGYAGILLTQNITSNVNLWKEYIEIHLPKLKIGTYHVSFRISKARENSNIPEAPITNHKINEIGAYFSKELLTQDNKSSTFNNGAHPTSSNPFINSGTGYTLTSGMADDNGEGGWQTVQGDLIITSDEQYEYLTIGHFNGNLWSHVDPSAIADDYIKMYYFIDDVQIQRYIDCNYDIDISKEDCVVDPESELIGTKYHVTITNNGSVCDEYNAYRLFQKGGEGYDNSEGEWKRCTDVTRTGLNSFDFTLNYNNIDIGKKVGLKIELYHENSSFDLTPLSEKTFEFVKTECCDCSQHGFNMEIDEQTRTSSEAGCCVVFKLSGTDDPSNPNCKLNKINIYCEYNGTKALLTTINPSSGKHITLPVVTSTICNIPSEFISNELNAKLIAFTAEFVLADGKICPVNLNRTLYCACSCDALPKTVLQLVPHDDNSNESNPDCCYDILLSLPENGCKFVFKSISIDLPTINVANLKLAGKITQNGNWEASSTPENIHRINFNYRENGTLIDHFVLDPSTNSARLGVIGTICIPKGTPYTKAKTSFRMYTVGGTELTDCPIDTIDLQCKHDCCDDNIFELIVSPCGEGTGCGEDQCVVSGKINLYTYDECPGDPFTFYSISPSHVLKYQIPNDGIITQYQFNNIGCLNKGKSRIETLKLYKGWDDPTPCVITDTIYCPMEDEVPPCSPDCNGENGGPNVAWIPKTLGPMALPNCPNCEFTAEYSYRTNTCQPDPLQEIQVTKFSTNSTDLPNKTACAACNMSAAAIYQLVLKEAVFQNAMGFIPMYFNGQCYDSWRVVQASCWVDYIDYLWSESGVVVYEPCQNSACCYIGITVCRISSPPNKFISITPNGTVSGGNDCIGTTKDVYDPSGLGIPHENPNGTVSYGTTVTLPCLDRCDWLNFSDAQYNNSNYYGKVSYNDLDFQLINPGNKLKLNVTVIKDLLDCYIYSNLKTDNCFIRINNILGQPLFNNKYNLSKGMNNYKFNLDNFSSGSYLIQLTVDGVVQSSEKFLIVK
jgi:hypothetical protein